MIHVWSELLVYVIKFLSMLVCAGLGIMVGKKIRKNKDVKNIALSGPYGSGKSSVIKTYLEKYPKTKYLSISLAAFSTPMKSVNGEGEDDKSSSLANDWTLDDVDENVIEEGILKQLFYRVDVGKIPQSRYRKIKKLSYWKMFFTNVT